jgi:hypothetical protein
MKTNINNLILIIALIIVTAFPASLCTGQPQHSSETEEPVKLDNPFSVSYLKSHLSKSTPKLILTPAIEQNLKQKIKSDPVTKNYYDAMKLNAARILKQDLLTRKMEGRRLLGTSREMLYRMNILCMVYRIEKSPAILKRITDEITTVCNFTDWNPSHFLDVAEMSMSVAIALDWTGKEWPAKTIALAKKSLIEKGIKPSYAEKGMGWIKGTNNWNQVCNGSMIAASIAIADKDPELAAKTIKRSLDGMPYALQEYAPDGVYPEGSTYWGYGTSFSIVTSSILVSAFGTDFGLANYPAFLKSADFRLLSIAPSGWYFNYADCGDKGGEEGDIPLAWFAAQTGNSNYYQKESYLKAPESLGKLPRIAGAGLVWLSEFKPKTVSTLPLAWKGDGVNPIVIFRSEANDPGHYYFGGKGGKATLSHGNMDAGSFVFELNGVRWSIDPGTQSYNEIEQTGFDLWSNCQECQRWILLSKNNFGHSTLTVNNALFLNNGFAPIKEFKNGNNPEATFDLTAVYGENMTSATRRFLKENDRSILIEDQFSLSKSTQSIVWQMMTTAEVEVVEGGAILHKDGKELKLDNLAHPELTVSVVSLDPPPFYLDKKIKGLKRIEIRLPTWTVKDGKGTIKVRLSGK